MTSSGSPRLAGTSTVAIRWRTGADRLLVLAVILATWQIGSAIGRSLLAANQPVRAVVRDAGKAQVWADRGCEIALANIEDTASLTLAFRGAESVFVLVPPNFDPAPEFTEARAIAAALRTALAAAHPARVVYLSTIGAQASQSNLLTQHTIIEATATSFLANTSAILPEDSARFR